MPDPFEQMRLPDTPLDPDPIFGARLRTRVERALAQPKGATMTQLPVDDHGGPRHGDVGYVSLWVPDAIAASEFFAEVLGWHYGPASGPGGRQVEGQSLHHGLWSVPGTHTLFLCFAVDSVDDGIERVRRAGGTAAEPTEEPSGLIAECVDDQGVQFALFTPPGGVSVGAAPAEHGGRHGDLAYITMEVPDSARTRAFYAEVLGWDFAPGRVEDGWVAAGVAPAVGISGGHDATTTVPMYRVDDIDAAVAAVRSKGGTSTDPAAQPYGVTAECADAQGTRFYLGQL